MKILFGMPSKDSWGGPATSEPPFVDALARLGVDVSTETYVYGDKRSETRFFSRVRRVISTAFRFRRRLSAKRFDLVHLNTAFDRRTIVRDSVSIFLIGRVRPRTFLKIHGAAASEIRHGAGIFRWLLRYLDRHVDGYGVFTHEESDELRALGLDDSKFYFVRNPIDIAGDVPGDHVRLQKEPSDVFDLLFVSRFISAKGLLATIRAAALLRDHAIKFRLYCLGDGPIRGEAEALVRKLKLEGDVVFTGYIPEADVTKRLLAGDIFVFPTTHVEGFPVALFKAAAVGLPIVTTKIRAAAEYFSEPDNCLFCTSDPTDIADQLERLITDKSMRERMSAANRKFGELLTPEAVAADYIKIYEQVCARSRPNEERER